MASISSNRQTKIKLFNLLTELAETKKRQDRLFPDLEIVRDQLLHEMRQEDKLPTIS